MSIYASEFYLKFQLRSTEIVEHNINMNTFLVVVFRAKVFRLKSGTIAPRRKLMLHANTKEIFTYLKSPIEYFGHPVRVFNYTQDNIIRTVL